MLLSGCRAAAEPQEEEFDARCWVEAAQSLREGCDQTNPCRSDCWTNVFTHSYCCVADSPCWWWGRMPRGEVVRLDAARSGPECRHICQAEPRCSSWSFRIPEAPDPDAGGHCALLGPEDPALEVGELPGDAAPGVVSGPRICAAKSPAKSPAKPPPAAAPETLATPEGARCTFDARSPHHAQGAAEALMVQGWAVVRGAITPEEVSALALDAQRAAEEILQHDEARLGNRGPRRYSYGGASRTHHMVHLETWSGLLDNAALRPVLDLAFGGDYVAVGGGGDFVLGATDTHQRLHVDLQLAEMYEVRLPPAAVVANFAVSDVSCDDGPMRIVPGTQFTPLAAAEEASRDESLTRASSLEKEAFLQERLGLRTVLACPLKAGDAVIRDMRLWHGGTPNRGERARLLPSAEFLSRWYASLTRGTEDHFAPRPVLPFANWLRMSDRGRAATRDVLSAPGPVSPGVRRDFVTLLPYVAEDRP